jgi:hypothetical protein
MPSSGMWCRVGLVRTDVSEDRVASIFRLERSQTSDLARVTWRRITEDDILHTRRRENLKSYIALTGCVLYRRFNVSPMRYRLGFYIPEDGILHSHRREILQSYICISLIYIYIYIYIYTHTYAHICIDCF